MTVTAGDGTHTFEFVIEGTGYQYEPSSRREFRTIADRIALWRDVYEPPADLRSESMGRFPYLGPGYQLTARDGENAPWIGDIHLFNAGALQSFGRPIGDIPSLRTGVPRLVTAIASDLYFADQATSRPAVSSAQSESFRDRYAHHHLATAQPHRSPPRADTRIRSMNCHVQ
ncbi:hypothetical protein ACFTS5_10970 [Nocardia sp. NPDC056952]|uniref:hypothetical protein n=1 Tax=Nocardia sp. NPDC056952 TaxID=3345979 RepID=UPI00363D324D